MSQATRPIVVAAETLAPRVKCVALGNAFVLLVQRFATRRALTLQQTLRTAAVVEFVAAPELLVKPGSAIALTTARVAPELAPAQ